MVWAAAFAVLSACAVSLVGLQAAVGLQAGRPSTTGSGLTASAMATHRDLLSGTYSGAGLTLTTDGDGQVAIGDVVAGSPAAASGFRVGDVVVRVANADVRGAHSSQVAGLLRGSPASKVSVVVRRGDGDVDVALTRTGVASRDVQVSDLADRTRIIRIDRFSAHVAQSVEQAVIEGPAPKAIVLDLRSNPGGRVDEAVAVAGVFLDPGIVATLHSVSSDGGDGSNNGAQALKTRGKALTSVPLVVLVDSGSASAAELLTGALQDRGRAVVAGAQTYGKGTVQIVTSGADAQGAGSVTTVARYTTPDGREVDGTGLTPDVMLRDPVSTTDAYAAARSILVGLV